MNVKNKLKNQSGAALVIALIMIIVLTLIGLASIFTSTFEISLSGNKRTSTDAFYLAETRSNTASNMINEINAVITYTPVSSNTDLSAAEQSSGLTVESEGINRKASILDPNSLAALSLPSGKILNDNTTINIYHSKWAGGGGEGTQYQKSDTFIIDTHGTDQVITTSLYKSKCQLRKKLLVRSAAPQDSQ
jgi:hypothetical protein